MNEFIMLIWQTFYYCAAGLAMFIVFLCAILLGFIVGASPFYAIYCVVKIHIETKKMDLAAEKVSKP